MALGALDIEADLTINLDEHHQAHLGNDGRTLVLRMESLSAARVLMRQVRGGRFRQVVLGQAGQLSQALKLPIEARVKGHAIARFGHGAEPNWLARWFGLDEARVFLGGLIKAALDFRSGKR